MDKELDKSKELDKTKELDELKKAAKNFDKLKDEVDVIFEKDKDYKEYFETKKEYSNEDRIINLEKLVFFLIKENNEKNIIIRKILKESDELNESLYEEFSQLADVIDMILHDTAVNKLSTRGLFTGILETLNNKRLIEMQTVLSIYENEINKHEDYLAKMNIDIKELIPEDMNYGNNNFSKNKKNSKNTLKNINKDSTNKDSTNKDSNNKKVSVNITISNENLEEEHKKENNKKTEKESINKENNNIFDFSKYRKDK